MCLQSYLHFYLHINLAHNGGGNAIKEPLMLQNPTTFFVLLWHWTAYYFSAALYTIRVFVEEYRSMYFINKYTAKR